MTKFSISELFLDLTLVTDFSNGIARVQIPDISIEPDQDVQNVAGLIS